MHRFMIAILTGLICLISLAPASAQSQIPLSPPCVQRICPACDPPRVDMTAASPACRECINANLMKLMSCSKRETAPPAELDLAGRWRSRGGLVVLIKYDSPGGYLGFVEKAPGKLADRYSEAGENIIEAAQVKDGLYRGRLRAPAGRWIKAEYRVRGFHMTSHHPGEKSVAWSRVIKVKTPDNSGAGRMSQ